MKKIASDYRGPSPNHQIANDQPFWLLPDGCTDSVPLPTEPVGVDVIQRGPAGDSMALEPAACAVKFSAIELMRTGDGWGDWGMGGWGAPLILDRSPCIFPHVPFET